MKIGAFENTKPCPQCGSSKTSWVRSLNGNLNCGECGKTSTVHRPSSGSPSPAKFKDNQPPGAFGGLDIPVIQPRMWSATFDLSAPKPLLDAYHDEYEKHVDAGKDHEYANARALAYTRNLGWVKTKDGWKKALPDVQDATNIAECIKQPDGTYFIEGIPCFHQNAVKGKELAFGKKDIRNVIRNTNSARVKPTIVEGHPNQLQAIVGKQLDAHGFAANFREHPTKRGLVLCDFFGVDPTYVKRLQDKKLTGISVGFAEDCHELNQRIGHVALLGGTSQALPHLPVTEYYDASSKYLCFSAGIAFFPRKENPMSKQDECYAAVQSAQEGLAAAQMACDVGQPDGPDRLKEAKARMKFAAKELATYAATMDETPAAEPGDAPMMPEENPSAVPEDTTAAYEAEGMEPSGVAPAMTPMAGPTGAFSAAEIKAQFASETGNPFAAFSAYVDRTEAQLSASNSQIAQLVDVVKILRTKDVANQNRAKRAQFDAKILEFRQSGRSLPKADYLDRQFSACFQTRDPDKALALVLEGYESVEPHRTPATFNRGAPVFDASSSNSHRMNLQPTKKISMEDIIGVVAKPTAEDLKFASLSEAFEG